MLRISPATIDRLLASFKTSSRRKLLVPRSDATIKTLSEIHCIWNCGQHAPLAGPEGIDQTHVEQKNYTHVRQIIGYKRLGHQELVGPLNELMRKWSLWKTCSQHHGAAQQQPGRQQTKAQARQSGADTLPVFANHRSA